MGKLYCFVMLLGVFLAISFGFVLPYSMSMKDDVGVIAAFAYLLIIVPTVAWYFGQQIFKQAKTLKEQFNKKLEG